MSAARDIILEILETLPVGRQAELLDFARYLLEKERQGVAQDLQAASLSSTGFWDNPIDDEVWNNV